MDDTAIGRLSDLYVEQWAQLDPCGATEEGIAGHDAEMTDFSPAGLEARAELNRRTRRELDAIEAVARSERVASEFMAERLDVELRRDELGEGYRLLNILWSPVHNVRSCFDLMARATAGDWETIAARLTQVPDALVGARLTYEEGMSRGLVAARRQALAVAQQCDVWGGNTDTTPFFQAYVAAAPEDLPEPLRRQLDDAAAAATAAYAQFGEFLRDTYAPAAAANDAVGRERYAAVAPYWLGMDVDLDETYAWGWEELGRIIERSVALAAQISPGSTLGEVEALLEHDAARSVEGPEAFRQWAQDLMDRAVADLEGNAFDIPEPARQLVVNLAAEGSAAAPYYSPPSEDFSRPGSVWYPVMGRTTFPLWTEVSTAYHEGVPGHHLQLAQMKWAADKLTRYQRMSGTSGHAEGWALYAERLMGELGYLDDPAWELGMLAAHSFRAIRVIIDIGMHLELAIPEHQSLPEPFHPGERWTPALGYELMMAWGGHPETFVRSEIDRYLGMPGQAISYKVGERVWLDARAEAEKRHGADFDLKAFHAFALDLGSPGLALLKDELATF